MFYLFDVVIFNSPPPRSVEGRLAGIVRVGIFVHVFSGDSDLSVGHLKHID